MQLVDCSDKKSASRSKEFTVHCSVCERGDNRAEISRENL